jgi:demethylspheroidene O-methyltransferase
VAADTLASWAPGANKSVLDVGGGHGVFLDALIAKNPSLSRVGLFDLPAVISSAQEPLRTLQNQGKIEVFPGSFQNDPLPSGFDVITLIRVLYDHDDEVVCSLLAKIFEALPAGGELLVSEPMRGHDQPTRAGDIYFGICGCNHAPCPASLCDQHGGGAEAFVIRECQLLLTKLCVRIN